jgi:hypothetical protein
MHIRVLPSQIPQVWEAVKYAVVQLDEVPQEQHNAYFVWLLQDLLSEKAQCWVTLNEDRVLLNVSLTRLVEHAWTQERELHVSCMYAFQGLTDETVTALLQMYMDCAKTMGCVRVVGTSRHPRAYAVMERQGLVPYARTYVKHVEG